MNANKVKGLLWVGGKFSPLLRLRGFDMVVLCANELQYRLPNFKGKVIHAGFDDSPDFTRQEKRVAYEAGQRVAYALSRGQKVLVTCHMGWNRSGLVAGLALKKVTDYSPHQIIHLIRKARGPDAMSNPVFVRFLKNAR